VWQRDRGRAEHPRAACTMSGLPHLAESDVDRRVRRPVAAQIARSVASDEVRPENDLPSIATGRRAVMQGHARLAWWEDNTTQATSASSPGPGTLRLPRSDWRRPGAHPAAARRYAVRSDHAGTRPTAPVYGCGPKSPDSHRAVWGLISRPPVPVRAFLRFPVCPPGFVPLVRRPVASLGPASSGSVPSAVAVRIGSPSVPLRVPFPLSNLHGSAAARRFCRRWSRAAGTKVTGSRRDPWPGSCRIRPQRRCSPERIGSRGAAEPAASLPTLGIS